MGNALTQSAQTYNISDAVQRACGIHIRMGALQIQMLITFWNNRYSVKKEKTGKKERV